MRTLGLLLLLAVVLVLASAAAAARVGAGQPSWSSLHRALRLERLAPGARCPVTPLRRLDHGRLTGVGRGPVYPLPGPFTPDDRYPAWRSAKTLWAWPAALRTRGVRVLVRGARLDGPGELRFQLGPDWGTTPLTRELRLETTHTVGAFGHSAWGATVTLLFVKTHGCYGLQLDSAAGTSTIVVRATAAHAGG